MVFKKKQHLESIMNKSGWDKARTKAAVSNAEKRFGISASMFDKLDLWNVEEELQEKVYLEYVEKRKKQKEDAIASVMEKTGWSHDEAEKIMTEAKEKIGIKYSEYAKYEFFNLDENEQKAKYEKVLAKRERNRQTTEQHMESIMKKTGWDREKAAEEIDDAKRRIGLSIGEYDRYDFHRTKKENQAARYEKILKKREKDRESRAYYISKVMEKTGWDYDYAVATIDEARKRTGCKYKEYYCYRFDQLTNEEQESIYMIEMSSRLSHKYNVSKEFVRIVNDKAKCNRYFEEFLKRPWCANAEVSLDEFKKIFSESNRIIYKPSDGIGGQGIKAFDLSADNMEEVYEQLKAFPKGVVEEYVVQHEDMAKLCPTSVNTIRVVTIVSKERPVLEDGSYEDIAYAAIRIGGGSDIVDNFHQGGMVAAIDLETGKIDTDAVNMEGDIYEKHPVTGVTIKGYQIPCFDEVKELVLAACKKEKTVGNLGWDIAISDKGPVIIEVNVGPGPRLLSVPYARQKIGKKYIFEKYI